MITVCGDILTDPSGEIDTSIIIANLTSATVFCEWEVRVRSGRTIQFSFDKFNLPKLGKDACEDNFIMVSKKSLLWSVYKSVLVIGPIMGNFKTLKRMLMLWRSRVLWMYYRNTGNSVVS